MAGETYRLQAVILGKTKLGEADCILRMLAENGELVEAVAKGARKPTSPFSAQLELYSHVELLLARGKSLDIVKEARLLQAHEALRVEPASAAAAAVVCEFTAKTAQHGLEAPRLFALTVRSIDAVAASPAHKLCLIGAAYLFKAAAMLGSRPRFGQCAVCGKEVSLEGERCRFSLIDGGVVDEACASRCEAELLSAPLVGWASRLLGTRFDELDAPGTLTDSEAGDARLGEDVLSLAERWVLVQFGIRMKSVRSLVQYCAL